MGEESYKNSGCKKYLLVADVSKQTFQFTLPDGNKRFKMIGGSIFALLFGTLGLIYATTLYLVFWNRSDYHLLDKSEAYRLTPENFQFGRDDGFAVAAAFWGP